MEPQTPFSTPVKSAAANGLNRASLGLNIATKFKVKAEAAKHRLEQKKMDEIIENTSVLVAVRIRPLNKRELRAKSSVNVIPSSKTSLSVLGENQYDDTRNFTFDAVLPERSTQKKAYDLTAKRILMKALDGFNGCIFAYGQTGSGKTYTMQGLPGLLRHNSTTDSDLLKYKEKNKAITALTSENEIQKSKIDNLNAEIRNSLQSGSELLELMQIENTDKSQAKERFSNDTLSALLSKLQNAYKLVHMKFSEEKETLEARNRYIEITMTRLHEAKLTIDKHLMELETNIKTSRKRIGDLEEENKELMSQRTVLEEKVQEQESKITDQDDALSRERKDKREAREAISKAVEKSNERIQEVKTLHTRIQKLETQLEKAVKQNRKLLDELHETSRLYHQSRRRTEEIQKANDKHANRDLELRRAISTKLNSLHNAESNLLAESELAKVVEQICIEMFIKLGSRFVF